MSYGTKYSYQFTDRFGRLVEVRILQRDYTGAVERIPTASGTSPLKMGKGKNEKNALAAIHATAVDFTMIANERMKYYDLYSYDEKAFKLEIDIAGQPHFVGWRIPDLYCEPLRSKGPRPVNFTFSCGLGLLADMPFDLTGKDTIQKVVSRILAKLELDLLLWWGTTITGIHAENSTETDLFNCDAYSDKDCLEVLEIILAPLGLRIQQDDCVWRVSQIEDMRDLQTFRVFNPGGAYLTTFTQNINLTPNNKRDPINGTCILTVDTATLNVQPVWKQFNFKQEYGYLKNIIINGDFARHTIMGVRTSEVYFPDFIGGSYSSLTYDDYAELDTWTNDGWETECDCIAKIGNGNVTWIGLRSVANDAALGSDDFILYTHAVALAASSMERLHIALKFGMRQVFDTNAANVVIEIKVGANYLKSDGTWTTTATKLKKSGFTPQPFAEMTANVFDITALTIPTGILTIKLFKCVASNGAPDVMYSAVAGDLVDLSNKTVPESKEESIVVDNYANYKGADQVCEMGDAPAGLPNALFYYLKVLSKPDGTPTQSWTYRGMTGSLAEHMKKRLLFFNLKPAFTIENTRLIGDLTMYKSCLNVAGRQFIFTGGSYDYKTAEWTGVTLAELPALPSWFGKLAAFFYRDNSGTIYDLIGNMTATVTGTDITWPNMVAIDIFDFGDPTYWNNALLPWYNAATPRTCPLSFMVGANWAEAATDATHARLFHRDYSSNVRDMLPVLVYKDALTAAEQADAVKWLDWYFVLTQGGDIIQQLTDTITQ